MVWRTHKMVEIPEQLGGFTDVINSIKSLAEGKTADALLDPEIPKAMKWDCTKI